MTVSLDKDLLATMTPEELAEIEGADDVERASLAATGAQKDPVHAGGNLDEPALPADEDAAAEGEAEPAAAAAPAAEPQAEAAEPEQPEPVAAAPAAPEPPAVAQVDETLPPVYSYQLPADYEERVAAAKTAREALLDRFEAGEVTREELRAEQARLDEEQRALDGMRIRADTAADMQRQAQETIKERAVASLFDNAAKAENGAIDYRKDEARRRDLDLFVRALAADDANADKPLTWFLNEAHRRVRVLHGDAAPAPTPAAPAPAARVDPKKAAVEKRRAPIPAEVADLSAVPGGGDPSDVGGEFADIMDLDGDAFEDAIARMAKTEPARFARFQAQKQ